MRLEAFANILSRVQNVLPYLYLDEGLVFTARWTFVQSTVLP